MSLSHDVSTVSATELWSGEAICELLNTFGIARHLEMNLVEVSGPTAVGEMVVTDQHASFPATAQTHGGAVLTLIDHVAGAAVAGALLLDPPLPRSGSAGFERVVAVELNANFVRLPHAGACITARARVVHQGRTLFITEISVTDQAERLVARSRQTCLRRDTN